MSAQVDRLEALLARIQGNRRQPGAGYVAPAAPLELSDALEVDVETASTTEMELPSSIEIELPEPAPAPEPEPVVHAAAPAHVPPPVAHAPAAPAAHSGRPVTLPHGMPALELSLDLPTPALPPESPQPVRARTPTLDIVLPRPPSVPPPPAAPTPAPIVAQPAQPPSAPILRVVSAHEVERPRTFGSVVARALALRPR